MRKSYEWTFPNPQWIFLQVYISVGLAPSLSSSFELAIVSELQKCVHFSQLVVSASHLQANSPLPTFPQNPYFSQPVILVVSPATLRLLIWLKHYTKSSFCFIIVSCISAILLLCSLSPPCITTTLHNFIPLIAHPNPSSKHSSLVSQSVLHTVLPVVTLAEIKFLGHWWRLVKLYYTSISFSTSMCRCTSNCHYTLINSCCLYTKKLRFNWVKERKREKVKEREGKGRKINEKRGRGKDKKKRKRMMREWKDRKKDEKEEEGKKIEKRWKGKKEKDGKRGRGKGKDEKDEIEGKEKIEREKWRAFCLCYSLIHWSEPKLTQ